MRLSYWVCVPKMTVAFTNSASVPKMTDRNVWPRALPLLLVIQASRSAKPNAAGTICSKSYSAHAHALLAGRTTVQNVSNIVMAWL